MSDLKNKYLFIEVTKSPPRASLCGPERIISKIISFINSYEDGVQFELSRVGNVMQIRLTGTEGKHDSTFLKMALLYEALNLKYEPMTLQSASDSLILTRSKEVE